MATAASGLNPKAADQRGTATWIALRPDMLAVFLIMLALAQADPVAAAADGLTAQIEDDNGPDAMMNGIRSDGCTVEISAQGKNWSLDLRKTEAVALEDTFVYIAAPPHKLAIVGDASKPDQATKLKALAAALGAIATRCRPPR